MSRAFVYVLGLAGFAFISAVSLRADVLRCTGVLGNSGEQGAALVRFGAKDASGMGIAFDQYGSIWDRGGRGVLNRYALDGRLLATYPLPDENPNRDADVITLAGDNLLLRMGNGLYSLPIDAPPGTAPKRLDIEAEWMSQSSRDGWVAAATRKGEVFLANASGERKLIATLKKSVSGIELKPDGAIFVRSDDTMSRVMPGEATVALSGPCPGERPQFLAGAWWGQSWASTVRRFDDTLHPSPGVVLGGNSGSFIGHVDEQAEVVNGRGLAQVGTNLFAVSGLTGVVHLLEWSSAERRLKPIRRIGAVRECNALALDGGGRVWNSSGSWEWNDGPATPMRFGVPPGPIFASTMFGSDVMVSFGQLYGKPAFYHGKLTIEVKNQRIEEASSLPEQAAAIATVRYHNRDAMLILTEAGKVSLAYVASDGKYEQDAGTTELITAKPAKRWTSLGSEGSDRLIGAAGGFVIEFARDGDRWRESGRWNSWGQNPADHFGDSITCCNNEGKLWVSDTARHRVICFGTATRKGLAEFGSLDVPGNILTALNSPRAIAASGNRAVVFDEGNQRIVKLELRAE